MEYIKRSILRMPKRRSKARKGDFGRVMIIGGSTDFVGAPILAVMAAKSVLRAGADLATLAAPAKVAWAANALSPDVITTKYGGDFFTMKHAKRIIKQAKGMDVVLLGCGIGLKSQTRIFARKIVKRLSGSGPSSKPMVIDADALKAIRLQDADNSILTPHKKEFEILLKNSGLTLKNFRQHMKNNVILLKGPIDMIISKSRTAYNRTGNPAMTKGGTGDVLAGLCAGFLAQTKDLFRSACMAAYLNGAVGDHLMKRRGRTFIASDIVENVHEVFR